MGFLALSHLLKLSFKWVTVQISGYKTWFCHIDLQVKNETNKSFKIKLWLDKTHLNGELMTNHILTEKYRIEERNHLIKQQYWGEYSRHNQIYQIKSDNDIETDKLLVENHAIMMYNSILKETNN